MTARALRAARVAAFLVTTNGRPAINVEIDDQDGAVEVRLGLQAARHLSDVLAAALDATDAEPVASP